MLSNSVCNHTRAKQIGLPLRGRLILLSLVWLQTELDSTQSYYTSGIHGYATKKNPEDNTASESIFSKISFGSLSITLVRISALGIS